MREAVNFWNAVAKVDVESKLPEFISTHPADKNRAEILNGLLPEALELRLKCNCAPISPKKPLGAVNLPEGSNEKVHLLYSVYICLFSVSLGDDHSGKTDRQHSTYPYCRIDEIILLELQTRIYFFINFLIDYVRHL